MRHRPLKQLCGLIATAALQWNGVFGEKHVRADINYSYSTNAGRRDSVGKTQTSPWLFTAKNSAYVLYGVHDQKADPKTDPGMTGHSRDDRRPGRRARGGSPDYPRCRRRSP